MIAPTVLEQTERIAQIGSWEWDLVSDTGSGSAGFFRIHGMERVGAIHLNDFLGPIVLEDRPAIEQAFLDALAGARAFDLEYRIVKQDSEELHYVHAWGEVTRNDQGQPEKMIGAVQDVTERVHQDLFEGQLAAIVENTDAAIVSADLNAVVLSWNHGAEKLYGYTAEEALGKSLPALIFPDGVDASMWLPQSIRSGIVIKREGRRHNKDGQLIDVAVTISPVRNRLGMIIGASAITHDITQLKQMEEELRSAERRFRTLIEELPVAAAIIDRASSTFVFLNPKAEFLLDTSHANGEVAVHNFFVDPADIARLAETLNHGAVDEFETQMKTASGRVFWASTNARQIVYQGRPAVLAVYWDTTARVQAEQALRESERQYRFLAENMTDVVWSMDLNSDTVTYISPSVELLRGFTPHEVMARPASDALTLTSQAVAKQVFTLAITELLQNNVQSAPRFEVEQWRRDGTTVWTETVGKIFHNSTTGHIELYGVTRDISQRKQLESELRASERQYRLLAENMVDVVWAVDLETGKFTYVSPSCERQSGYTVDEIKAQPFGWRLTPESRDFLHKSIEFDLSAYHAGEPPRARTLEFEELRRDGSSYWFEAMPRISVNTETGKIEAYGVSRDITERRAKEDEIRALNSTLEQRVVERTVELHAALEELRKSDEMKNAFLASVSHELRTPLTGVLGLAEALELQTAGPLNERQLRYTQQIHQSGERLLKLVNSIMNYVAALAGRVTANPMPCRLSELGASSLRARRGQIDAKQLTAKLIVEPEDVEIVSDVTLIKQILDNLLDNAIKFTPPAGNIGLDILGSPDQETVQLIVWDTGIGITSEKTSLIFGPFTQLDNALTRKFEGVGLGLAYTAALVKLLGGAITVASELEQGSRFSVTLPMKSPAAKP